MFKGIAISNLSSNDILRLHEHTKHIEIAPSIISSYTKFHDFIHYRDKYESFGMTAIALQSVMYNTNFQLATINKDIFKHFEHVIEIANIFKVKTIVIGSPKNRNIIDNYEISLNNACKNLEKLGLLGFAHGATFVIESSPLEYGSEYLNRLKLVVKALEIIDHPNVRLHIDTGSIMMCNDDMDLIEKHSKLIKHVHISNPSLVGFEDRHREIHQEFAQILKGCYDGYITMQVLGSNNLKGDFDFVKSIYGS